MAVYKKKESTKDGRQYYFRIRYKDIQGITRDYSSPKYKTKKEAEIEEARFKLKVEDKDIIISNITLEEAFLNYHEQKKKKLKKQSYIKDINLFKYMNEIKDKKINDIDLRIYNLFIAILEKEDISVEYKNRVLGLFRQIIKYSSKYYNTSDSILKYVENFKEVNKMKKEMQFFTFEEYQKFDSVIDNLMHHTFFEVLYFMGLRQGECQALTWKDIDFDKGQVNITKTLTTKIKGEKYTISSPKTKNSIRVLPLTDKLVVDLKSMKKEAMKYANYEDDWFIFGNALPFPETTIQKIKNKYCKEAEVKQIRIHDFRHSCASLLINQGASIALVSKWLGHANITITLNTYTHMYKSELDNIANVLNNL